MNLSVTEKIIKAHLLEGELIAGSEIALKIDQTLTQDATGTMAYLQLEATGIDKVKTEISVSYIDHNTIQMGFKNPDDHRYLRTVAAQYGVVFSPAGTGICHQLHLENFAKPGKTLIGSDSHTPTAGGLAMLAMGAGGLSVALAMAGKAYSMTMPHIIGVELKGKLQGFSAAKDIILELLHRLTVKGGVNKVFEFFGDGVTHLSVPERATITNMGAELGATCSLFPSDEQTRKFLSSMGRAQDFIPLVADENASYHEVIVINLDELQPLVACPHMPDKVMPVAELAGLAVQQVAIGSCTNSSYADLKMVALLLKDKKINPKTDLLISPGSKQVLAMLAEEGLLTHMLTAGARLLECTCGPCIGMGGSPQSASVSVRTFNRNFEARSGTLDAQVYLVSAQTAVQVALHGQFTDPNTWQGSTDKIELPASVPSIRSLFIFPEESIDTEILRGPNIVALERFSSLPETLRANITLKVGDNITTDHILPAGAEITALRSNIPAISEYIYSRVDADFVERCKKTDTGVIIGGENYGQGSSREHAALAPRYLGVQMIIAKSFARIHHANLVNFGILPLVFVNGKDYDNCQIEQELIFNSSDFVVGGEFPLSISGETVIVTSTLTEKEWKIIQAGGLLNTISL